MHHRSLRFWAGLAIAVALPAGAALAQVPQLPPVPTAVPVPVPSVVPVPVPTAVPVPKSRPGARRAEGARAQRAGRAVPERAEAPHAERAEAPRARPAEAPGSRRRHRVRLGPSAAGARRRRAAGAPPAAPTTGAAAEAEARRAAPAEAARRRARAARRAARPPRQRSRPCRRAARGAPARARRPPRRRANAASGASADCAASVVQLAGCLGEVAAGERRVLVLRAGAGDRRPLSRQAVAERLDTNVRPVARTERRGVRHLRAAARGGACGGLEPGAGTAIAGDGGEARRRRFRRARPRGSDPRRRQRRRRAGRHRPVRRQGLVRHRPGGPGPATLVRAGRERRRRARHGVPLLLLAAFVTGFAIMWTVQGRRGGGARTA